ncbi:hypothetical protein JHK82_053291 [Glycine max]|nr:hypothetical protein JHK84_053159 [Glycine max]KAG5085894.1 hypothetical protein JHK82_053291 [Glycine max]
MPKRPNTPPKVDFSKHCRYLRNRGHLIEECSVLKDKIEDLIKLGHLKDFVHEPQSYRKEQDKGRDRDRIHHSQNERHKS